MKCGVGLRVTKTGGDVIISYLYDKGAALNSGLLKLGDVLLAVDKQSCSDKTVDEIQEMLSGENGSNVQLKYRRGGINMACTLTRQSETDFVLEKKHTGWKPAFESPQKIANKATENMAQRIHHGQEKINEKAVYKHLEKMTPEELAQYNEERKKEAEESIKAADKLVASLEERDRIEAEKIKAEALRQKDPRQNLKEPALKPKTGKEEPAPKPKTGKEWYDVGLFDKKSDQSPKTPSNEWSWPWDTPEKSRYERTKDRVQGAIAERYVEHKLHKASTQVQDAAKRDNERRAASTMWPWEVRNRDDKWVDAHVPTFLDWCEPRKAPPGNGANKLNLMGEPVPPPGPRPPATPAELEAAERNMDRFDPLSWCDGPRRSRGRLPEPSPRRR